ncbi:MAG: UPF0058 family protein [Candidatus Nanohalobium sp.]
MSSFSKQEFIHLHGLFYEVGRYLDEKGSGDYSLEEVESYQEYLELGVKPTSIQENKTDHKEAVFLLADSVQEYLEEGSSLQDLP